MLDCNPPPATALANSPPATPLRRSRTRIGQHIRNASFLGVAGGCPTSFGPASWFHQFQGEEPPLRPRNGRGSTPTPATWLRTISLGPTHEQPTCTRPTPTRRTNIVKGWRQGAANACHTTIQAELHSCLDPASQAVLESESGPHAGKPFTTIPYHADTTYECHPFRILLLRRLRLPVPLTTSHCWCKSGLTPSPMSTISGGCSVKQLLMISTLTLVLFVSKKYFF